MEQANTPQTRQSIRTRLLVLIIGLVLFSIIVIAFTSINTILRTGQNAQDAGNAILRQQAEETLLQLTIENANGTATTFADVRLDAGHIAEFIAAVYSKPDAYDTQTYWRVDERMFFDADNRYVNAATDTTSVFAPNNVEIDEAFNTNLELSAYLDELFPPIFASNPNSVAMYLVHKDEFTRFYPNIDLGTIVPPDFKATEDIFFTIGTPANNPEQRVEWTEIYDDPAGQGLLVTAVAPIYTDQEEFLGIIGIDLSLNEISADIEENVPFAGGYSLLIDENGTAVALPAQGYEDILGTPLESGSSGAGADLSGTTGPFAPLLANMQNGETGFQAIEVGGRELFVGYAPVPGTRWSMASVVPAATLLQVVEVLQTEIASSTQSLVTFRILPISAAILILAVVVGLALTNRLVAPVQSLAVAAEQIGAGNWEQTATIAPETRRQDEIGVLARSFADMAAQLEESINSLEQRVTERTGDLALAAEVSRRVVELRDLDELLHDAVTLIRDRFDLYYAQIYLINEAGSRLVYQAGTGEVGKQLQQQGHFLPVDNRSINGTAVSTQHPVLVPDTQQDARFRPNSLLPQTRAELSIPLVSGTRVLGVLDLQDSKVGGFSEENLPAFTTLARQLAIAIRNARLFAERQQAVAELVPFRLGFERSASVIFMTDVDGTITYVNPAFTRLYGYTEQEALGQNPRILKSGLTPQEQYERTWRTLLANEPFVGEIINQSKDGRFIHVSINNVPITDDGNNIVGFLAMQTDITDRKEAQAALNRSVAELNCLNEIGRKAEEAPPVPEFLTWAARRIPPAMDQPDKCIAAFTLGDDVYGDATAVNAPRQMVEGLRIGSDQVGRLYIAYTDETLTFADEDSAFIGGIGRRISSYIESRRLLQTMTQQAEELQTVAEIGTAVAAIRNPQELLQTFVDLTQTRFNLYHVHVYDFDPEAETLRLTAASGDTGPEIVAEADEISLHQEKSLVARAARLRDGIIVNDVQQDAGYLPLPQLPLTRAEMVVPMLVFDQLRGVVDLQAAETNAFTETDLSISTTLAAQVGVALENAAQHTETQAALAEVRALQRIMTREGWQAFLTARERSVYGFAAADRQVRPIARTAAAQENVLSLDEVARDKTAVLAPVQLGDTAIGTLGVYAGDRPLTNEQQALLHAISEQVGQALERARLAEQTQIALSETEARTEELALLNEMSQELTAQTNVDDVLDVMYDYTSRLIDVEELYIALYYAETDEVAFAFTAVNGKIYRHTERRRAGTGITEHIIRHRKPLLMPDNVDQHLAELGIASYGRRAQSWVGVPMTFGNEVVGVLGVQNYTTPGVYQEPHLRLLTAVASQVAIAIENARLIEATEERARDEQMLREVTTRVSTAVDAETILRHAAEELGKAFGVDAFVVLNDEPGNGRGNGHQEAAD